MIPLITWLSLIEGLSLCIYPFLQRALNDKAASYALSKALGIFSFGYIVWVLGLIGAISIDIPHLVIVLLTILFVVHLFVKRQFEEWDLVPYPSQENIAAIEILFFASFFIFYVIQAFHPEIYWGEKPMDFTFLNFFTRNTALPPQDPWASGNIMSYYYFGSLLFGILHKLSGMAPEYGYGVSVATVASLLTVSIFSAVYAATHSKKASFVGGSAVVFLGTYDALYLWFGIPIVNWLIKLLHLRLKLIKTMPFGFDLYWATSRTFNTPGINEYPLWTILFADLHAHFIAFPLTATLITLTILYIRKVKDAECWHDLWPTTIIVGFVWGFLAAVNTWDFITFGVLVGISCAFLCLAPSMDFSLKRRTFAAVSGVTALVASVFFSLPFHLSVTSNAHIQWGYVYPEEYSTFFEIFRIHGHWLLLFIAGSIVLYSTRQFKDKILQWAFFLVFGFVPVWMGFSHIYLHNIPSAPWGVLVVATIFTALGALLFRVEDGARVMASSILVYCAGLLLAVMELHFLMDRMNTTFKVNNAIWPLLGIGALSSLSLAFDRIKDTYVPKKVLLILAVVTLIPCLVATTMNIIIMSTFIRLQGSPRPSLDGTSYLHQFNPTEKEAFNWINKNIQGTPVLVEAFGPSYQEYTRFSMNTGLPVVLGWEYHVEQRGSTDTGERKKDVQTIYNTRNVREALSLLNKYDVSLIIVGRQERLLYSHSGLSKFEEDVKDFPVLFQAGEGDTKVQIFTTSYSNIRR